MHFTLTLDQIRTLTWLEAGCRPGTVEEWDAMGNTLQELLDKNLISTDFSGEISITGLGFKAVEDFCRKAFNEFEGEVGQTMLLFSC